MSQIVQPQMSGNCPANNDTETPSPEEQVEAYFQSMPSFPATGESSHCLVEEAEGSPGYSLPEGFLDPVLCDSDVVLLARKNGKLVAFKGSGYLEVKDGKVSIVQYLKTKISQLWHNFTRSSGQVILGSPKAAPFLAIVDEYRQVHAIGGLPDGDSQLVHTPGKGWEVIPIGKVPKKQQGRLPEADAIQLTGYTPLSSLVSDQTVRELTALKGEGILLLTQQPAPKETGEDGCPVDPCGENLQSVATLFPFPGPVAPCDEEPECYTLKFCTNPRGLKYVADTPTSLTEGTTGNA